MLTQKDLDEIENLIDEKIKFLPTKDDFYGKMDEVMGELKDIREEFSATTYRVSNHEDRIVKVEEKTGIATI